MLTIEQMLARLVVAIILGGLLGLERELVGKEAGVRTEIVVAAGASIFTMIAIVLPYITAETTGLTPDLVARDSAFGIIANVVVGIGFLGAGLIIRMGEHPRGLTTAALVWTTAAIGVLAGVGLIEFATFAAVLLTVLLYILRKMNVSERLERESGALK